MRLLSLATVLAICLPAAGVSLGGVHAQEKIKVGIVGPFSGPFASTGIQFRRGIETYVSLHGNRAGGKEIELLYRDVGGTNPAVAKRLAEELIVKDKVSLLAGFYLSPEGYAVAPVVTETKTPTVLFVTSSPPVVTRSPYFVRMGGSIWQYSSPAAEWAIQQGKKRAYIAVADYQPGYDVQEAFRTKFTQLGGQIAGEDRIPLNTVDFAPFAERVARANPDVVNVFVPAGSPAVNFMKALSAQGVIGKITVIGQAETDDPELKQFDKSVVGVYSCLYYAVAVPGEANRKFKQALQAKFGADAIPNFSMVNAYDGMHIVYRMIEAQKGKAFDPDAAMAAVKGYTWESPRGPITIEADSRDATQNVYIRKVELVGGRLENVIIHTFKAVRDPWREQKK